IVSRSVSGLGITLNLASQSRSIREAAALYPRKAGGSCGTATSRRTSSEPSACTGERISPRRNGVRQPCTGRAASSSGSRILSDRTTAFISLRHDHRLRRRRRPAGRPPGGDLERRAPRSVPRAVTRPARRGLTLGPLVAVMFFTVSGGPFGLEGLVGQVGPGLALLLLLATPLLYSVPEALLIGELASMLPVEGGYYQWVKRAFGRFWGFWNGWLSWTYSLVDMAIYPVLFLQYLRFFAPGLNRFDSWLVALLLIWGATWLNLRGTQVVGAASRWFVAAVLLPFAVLSAAALVHW